jgi:HAD superfamily hydrolase (TIGR01450 family)
MLLAPLSQRLAEACARRALGRAAARRAASTRAPPPAPRGAACVFDIDGVLLRGSAPLPHAREALLRLNAARVPWILLTNGGGEPEAVKAAKLSKILALEVDVAQVVLSHTPMRALCAPLAHRRVLILGCRDVEAVAASYGLRRAVTARQLLLDEPARYPFIDVGAAERRRLPDRDEPIAAVMVLHDPNSWGLEIQVAMDVLHGGVPFGTGGDGGSGGGTGGGGGGGGTGGGGGPQAVPYYSSNADLLFAAEYAAPRLAGGSFTVALRALWRAQHGAELAVTQFGKPQQRTFDFARKQLARWAAVRAGVAAGGGEGNGAGESGGAEHDGFERIFMIGDNPRSDIRGANAAGAPWHSVLVRTGVFRGGDNDPDDPAKSVLPSVREAVDLALGS